MCKRQSESQIGTRIVIAARPGQVGRLTSAGETDDQIIEGRHDMTESRDRGAPRIFMEPDIAAIVQAILNAQCSRFN